MSFDPRVQQLIEEVLESERSVEAVCHDSPELQTQVREGCRRVRAMQAQVSALFPAAGAADFDETMPLFPEGLPEVPGYDVTGELGRGGVGVVYRARHLRLNRPVALKMLLAGACASRAERQRLSREAELVAELRHPNIVQVYDVGDLDGRPYFTMELVEGGSLDRKLAGQPLPAREAASLLAVLAQAIEAAHRAGIVHRDLKPSNVLLTADDTPKISDFGLGRHLGIGPALTQSGVPLGTPSYMAPEQAQGKSRETGPAADLYALGAILYELLTGRPPFRAESAAATVQLVLSEDPVPPSRLNPHVPRDLETICLKCLHKDARRRYATAAALADDLNRFLRDQPIAARRVGRLERALRWLRRNPTAAALIVTAALLIGLAGAAGLRERELAVRQRADLAWWSDRLASVHRLQEEARFAEARAILREADPGAAHLQSQIEQARAILDLAERLDAVRLGRSLEVRGIRVDFAASSRQYAAIFREAGLGDLREEPGSVAQRVAASPIRRALIAALDDWAFCADQAGRDRTGDQAGRDRIADWAERDAILGVARAVDRDPWRDRVRDAGGWDRVETFPELASSANVREQPLTLMLAFGARWRRLGGASTSFMKRVDLQYPNDFWVNTELGRLLEGRDVAAAVGYYRAAVAARPDEALGHSNLGRCLARLGLHDEAAHHYQRVLEISPAYSWARTRLGESLAELGRIEEAIDEFRQDLAAGTDPLWPRQGLFKLGCHEEVRADWRRALKAGPTAHDDWHGYAELCLFLVDEAEYRRARRELLTRFAATTDPHVAERVGRACLLLPAADEELRQAAELIDRAVAADRATYASWAYPFFLFAKGLAEYRRGRFDSAIGILQGPAAYVMGPAPNLVLAMAQHRRGDRDEAKRTLALAVFGFDWRATSADGCEMWIYHALRREAEALLLPDLPGFLAGTYYPTDPAERRALVGVCRVTDRTHALARLYADIFADAPRLADDLRCGRRYDAACLTARAGCGSGADAARLGDEQRARWRKQARGWLSADLTAWSAALAGGSHEYRELAKKRLAFWQTDPDLAGLRDEKGLADLPEPERAECRALWDQVAATLKRAAASD
jgi:serine/threonine-protein kinase